MSIRPRHTTSVHPTQAVSWFLLVMFVSTFYALFLLYLGTVGRAVVGVFYGLLVVCVVVCAAYGSLQDPADPHVYDAQDSESQVEAAALIASRSPSALRDISYCFRCERYVNTGSRHCTICQKCIAGFDHHCVWLNNCIGSRNYISFLALLVFSSLMLLLQLAVGVYLIVEFASSKSDFNDRVREFYPSLSGIAFFIICIVIMFFALGTAGMVLQLASLHALLISRNLTTFDFVIMRQNKQRVREQHQSDVLAQQNLRSRIAQQQQQQQQQRQSMDGSPGALQYELPQRKPPSPHTPPPPQQQHPDIPDRDGMYETPSHSLEVQGAYEDPGPVPRSPPPHTRCLAIRASPLCLPCQPPLARDQLLAEKERKKLEERAIKEAALPPGARGSSLHQYFTARRRGGHWLEQPSEVSAPFAQQRLQQQRMYQPQAAAPAVAESQRLDAHPPIAATHSAAGIPADQVTRVSDMGPGASGYAMSDRARSSLRSYMERSTPTSPPGTGALLGAELGGAVGGTVAGAAVGAAVSAEMGLEMVQHTGDRSEYRDEDLRARTTTVFDEPFESFEEGSSPVTDIDANSNEMVANEVRSNWEAKPNTPNASSARDVRLNVQEESALSEAKGIAFFPPHQVRRSVGRPNSSEAFAQQGTHYNGHLGNHVTSPSKVPFVLSPTLPPATAPAISSSSTHTTTAPHSVAAASRTNTGLQRADTESSVLTTTPIDAHSPARYKTQDAVAVPLTVLPPAIPSTSSTNAMFLTPPPSSRPVSEQTPGTQTSSPSPIEPATSITAAATGVGATPTSSPAAVAGGRSLFSKIHGWTPPLAASAPSSVGQDASPAARRLFSTASGTEGSDASGMDNAVRPRGDDILFDSDVESMDEA